MKLPRINRYIPKDELVYRNRVTKGLCDNEEKAIYINPKLRGKDRLVTCVHEMLHFIHPKAKEVWVEKNGVLLGEVLWRLGYRSKSYVKRTSNDSKNSKRTAKR